MNDQASRLSLHRSVRSGIGGRVFSIYCLLPYFRIDAGPGPYRAAMVNTDNVFRDSASAEGFSAFTLTHQISTLRTTQPFLCSTSERGALGTMRYNFVMAEAETITVHHIAVTSRLVSGKYEHTRRCDWCQRFFDSFRNNHPGETGPVYGKCAVTSDDSGHRYIFELVAGPLPSHMRYCSPEKAKLA